MKARKTLAATSYAIVLGLAGIGALVAVTNVRELYANAVPLAFFAALSFVLKRAGFHVAPEVTHSLVGIVDLAAIFIFGPVLGAWVAATSGFVYLFLNAIRHERHTLYNLAEIPIFNAGLKVGMTYASTRVYLFFGGQFAPHEFTPPMVVPFIGALLVWFAMDHIGWGLLEFLRGGVSGLVSFLRTIVVFSVLVELLPLPFAIVIAVVYLSHDLGVFVVMAFGLVGTAVVVQRFADASAHLERRRKELAVLNEFGQALSQAGFDVNKLLELLCQDAQRIAPAEMCRIELFDRERGPEGSSLLALEMTGAETRRPQTQDRQDGSPWVAYFSARREPVRAVDLAHSSVLPEEAAKAAAALRDHIRIGDRPPRSALIVPLIAGDEPIGALFLLSAQPGAFLPVHARNLLSMCTQAAVATQNARLFAVERRRAVQLAMVSDVSRQVAAVLDLDDLLQQVVTRIRERFGYANVHIFTVDRDAGYVVFRASTHPRAQVWREQGLRLRMGLEGIVGWVAAMGEPLVVDDVQKERRFVLDPDRALEATRSEVAVPLVVGTQVVGVLDVQSEETGAFGEEDLFVLKTLAAQVGIAVEDARLFDSQREEAWYLNVLLQVAENLSATTDLEEALETVARITPLLVGVSRCAVLLYDPTSHAFSPAKAYGLTNEQLEAFYKLEFRADDQYALAKMWRDRAPVVVEGPGALLLVRPQVQELFGIRSLLVAPLLTRGEIVGAMLVDQGTRVRHFSPHEIQVVMGIANQAAVAIEGARLARESEGKKRLDYELGLARQIQESFLPEGCPVLPGYQICSTWQAAREVSGDFYDFIPLGGGRWGIAIADVSDKGMAAALFMALSRTILRTMAIGKPTPHEAVERANDVILADARSEMFVTVFFSVLEPSSGRLAYVNAGHNPPLLYRAQRRAVAPLKGHGIALGVEPNISMEDLEIVLEPGDVLLMYTDGVTDAFNGEDEEFGVERLSRLLASRAGSSAEGLIGEITREVTEFVGEDVRFDDVTMIAIKRLNEHEAS